MKFGLIGHPLGNIRLPEIHDFFIHETYEKRDLTAGSLDAFMKRKDFDGINVSSPHQQAVIPYLDEIDRAAEEIGAVNCITNRNGILKGWNTDYIGFRDMLVANGVDVKNKKIAVLGTGSASKAICYALKELGATAVSVSRSDKPGTITYEKLYERRSEFACVVNTTPVGMAPNTSHTPLNLEKFDHVEYVIDIIADPLRTALLFRAQMLGMKTLGGFEMLVRQAAAADEIFTGKKPDESLVARCMDELYRINSNIVVIGMPTGGKTTLSALLHEETGLEVVEMDDVLEARLEMSIRECFDTLGETYFRDMEHKLCKELARRTGCIISCGGGVIKNEDNMRLLRENGFVVWVRRDVDKLFTTHSRPLTGDLEYMRRLYEERKGLYEKYCDVSVDNNATLQETINEMMIKLRRKKSTARETDIELSWIR